MAEQPEQVGPDFDPEPQENEEPYVLMTPSGQRAFCYQCDDLIWSNQGMVVDGRDGQAVALHPWCAKQKPRPSVAEELNDWRRQRIRNYVRVR